MSAAAIGAERFRDVVGQNLGLSFDDSKLDALSEVMKRRAAANGQSTGFYVARLEAQGLGEEAGPLAEELTVGETYFFRNGDQFRAFSEHVLPERMAARAPTRQLRFLSAGCSSGEEPFTLAIILREMVQTPPWNVVVRAVDINPAVLQRAQRGRFSSWALRDTSPALRQRWFHPDGRDMVLDADVRTAVQFSRRNLAEDDPDLWPANAYDAIFCRNVIMYFTPAVARAVVARIERSLVPGGYLFLGHAETLRGLSNSFHLVHEHGTFFYQRKRWPEEPPAFDAISGTSAARPDAAQVSTASGDGSWFEAIGNATRRIVALTGVQPWAPTLHPAARPRQNLAESLDLLRRERFTDALTLIEAMPEDARSDPDVMLLQAVLLANGGKLVEAAAVCRDLLRLDELNAGANYMLALSFEGVGDYRSAANHYRVAVYLEPDFAMPRLHLGLLARRAGDLDSAREALELALMLLRREDAARLLLFGGGFTRDALIALCEAELRVCRVRQ